MGKNVVKGTAMIGAAIFLPAGGNLPGVSLGKRLEWILEHRDVSASALSLKAGQSRAYVRKLIDREPKRPDFTALARIAQVAGVPERWLTHGEGGPGAEATDLTFEREPEHIPADDEVPQETAVFRVYVNAPPGRYTTADFDSARGAVRGVDRKALPDGDHDAHAAQLLDAARSLRQLGVPATVQNVMARALGARTEREASADQAFNAESDETARAHGVEPGQGAANLAAARARRGRAS